MSAAIRRRRPRARWGFFKKPNQELAVWVVAALGIVMFTVGLYVLLGAGHSPGIQTSSFSSQGANLAGSGAPNLMNVDWSLKTSPLHSLDGVVSQNDLDRIKGSMNSEAAVQMFQKQRADNQ